MKKRDFLHMVADRIKGDRVTQVDIDKVFDAMIESLNDVLEYHIMESNECVKLQRGVRFVVKIKKPKVIRATTLKNINTGEPIIVPEQITPERRMIVLEGFEVDS